MRSQSTTISATAEFKGKNSITAGPTGLEVFSTIEGSTLTVTAQRLGSTTLLIHTGTLATENSASQARIVIQTAITRFVNAFSSLGLVSKRFDIQAAFTGKLMDIIKQGVGNFVDTGLAEESANSQAIQIKQELGVQPLAIAILSPKSILVLFQ